VLPCGEYSHRVCSVSMQQRPSAPIIHSYLFPKFFHGDSRTRNRKVAIRRLLNTPPHLKDAVISLLVTSLARKWKSANILSILGYVTAVHVRSIAAHSVFKTSYEYKLFPRGSCFIQPIRVSTYLFIQHMHCKMWRNYCGINSVHSQWQQGLPAVVE